LHAPGSESDSRRCLAAGHDRTADLLSRRGFDVRTIELSEFAKAEGGVIAYRFSSA